MTHDTIAVERESEGSLEAAFHRIDITALDAAGAETYDPSAELGIQGSDRFGIDIRDQADESVDVVYDSADGELKIRNRADDSDVAAGTAVGELLLHVVGV